MKVPNRKSKPKHRNDIRLRSKSAALAEKSLGQAHVSTKKRKPLATHRAKADPCGRGPASSTAGQSFSSSTTPLTNRGVVSAVDDVREVAVFPAKTDAETKPTRIGIDWLTFSRPKCTREQRAQVEAEVARYLCALEVPTKAGHGYEGHVVAAYGSLSWRPHRDGTADCLLNLSGQAMQYARHLGHDDEEILRFCIHHCGAATRLDCAIDVYDPEVTPQLAGAHWRKRAVVSRADEAHPRSPDQKKGEPPPRTGWTWYFGSQASARFMRVYDKTAEFHAKTGSTMQDHVTRFELVSRDEAAHKLALLVAESGIEAGRAVIAGWIDFKTLRGAAEVKKRHSAAWWSRIVCAEKCSLRLDPRIATPERTLAWLKSEGVARAIKLAMAFGQWDAVRQAAESATPPPEALARWQAVFERTAAVS